MSVFSKRPEGFPASATATFPSRFFFHRKKKKRKEKSCEEKLSVLEYLHKPKLKRGLTFQIYRDSEKRQQMKHIKAAKGIHKTQSRF